MSEKQLMALCILLMCDDPTVLNEDHRKSLENLADKESMEFGFDSWIDFDHYYSLGNITTKGGVLYRGEHMLDANEGDRVASVHGLVYAEHLVKHLEGPITTTPPKELMEQFKNKLTKHDEPTRSK